MNRQRHTVLALAAAILLAGVAAAEQAQPAAAPAKLAAPARGQVEIAHTKFQTKVVGTEIITTVQLKNTGAAPIAGLKLDEFWYDKAGDPVTGDTYRHRKLFLPGEVITVTLKTPRNPKMDRNSYNFSHANGTIKPKLVPKM